MTTRKRQRTVRLMKLSKTPQQIAWAKKSASTILAEVNEMLMLLRG